MLEAAGLPLEIILPDASPRSSAGPHRSAAHSCLLHSRRQNAISSATAWRSMYWSSSRWALKPSSRFCLICTMRSGLANSPTTSGRRTVCSAGGGDHLPARERFFYCLDLAGERVPKSGNTNKKAAVVTLG
jgi:hypothetical protein